MNIDFLKKYLNTNSPSTNEQDSQRKWIAELEEYADEVITDNYGNVALLVKGTKHTKSNNFKVVIDAHADEIGWIVKSISDDGFLKVQRNGGTDNDITMGTAVNILTRKGNVKGFFGSPAIHLKDRDSKGKVEQENLAIDVAALTKEDVEKLGIEVGSFVVVDRVAEIMNEKFVVGKSLDDKVGGFIHSEVLKKLKEDKIELPYDLYIVNSVQEEVGLRGASMMSDMINPDVAIAFDVTFDTNTPGINKDKHGDFKMGEGIVLRQGFDVHNNFLKLLKDCAKENDINYKIQVGGSDRKRVV